MDPTMITGRVSERVFFSVHAFNLHVIVNLCIGVYKLIKYFYFPFYFDQSNSSSCEKRSNVTVRL
jgi:hypothetical protein